MINEPPGVHAARMRAASHGFDLSCENGALVDLVFADAAGAKIDGLDGTIEALRPGGVLVVDDMDSSLHEGDGLLDAINRVRDALLDHPLLVAAELNYSSGMILAAKRSR